MKQTRQWHVESEPILTEIREVHPADQVRILALDLAQCGQEVEELRDEVQHLHNVIRRLKETR